MSLVRGKARIVTFRVSAQEFDLLTQSCLRSGARSLSEFSREAIFDKVDALNARSWGLNRDLNTLAKELGDLDDALREASARISRLLGPVGIGPEDQVPMTVSGRGNL